jgi:hypothetical protein
VNPVLFGFFILFFAFMGGVIGWTAHSTLTERREFAAEEAADRTRDKARRG